MKKLIVCIWFLSLSACGTMKPLQESSIESEFTPFIQTYETYKGSSIDPTITIKFGPLPEGVGGTCSYRDNAITINPVYWSSYLEYERKLTLIMHELGHCDLRRGHRNDLDAGGTPVSIMYYVNIFASQDELETYYVPELFGREIPSQRSKTRSSTMKFQDLDLGTCQGDK